MSYLTSNLVPGEVVTYRTRLHWIVMLGNLAIACLLLASGAAVLYYSSTQTGLEPFTPRIMQGIGAGLMLLCVIAILMGQVRRNATEMAITNRRVIVKTGLASRRTIEMLLNKVESIEVSETSMGRLLGYGAIVVVGTGGSTEPFRNIAHPLKFRSQLQQQIEQAHIQPVDITSGEQALSSAARS